jgi:GT2 family glycosyltransferase
MALLTVEIPTYDGRALLEVLLPSLERQTFQDFQVVVVDDGSSDGTAEWLRERWPRVTVVELPERRGVTAALNACLRAGRTELVALVNNDTELDPGCLEALVDALRTHPEAGSAAPKMLDFADRGVLDGAGDMLSWRGGGRRRGHGERDAGQYDQAADVFGPCGGAGVYRRTALDAVGPLDERYHAYYEDVDWAFRAQLAGFGCRYVPTAVLYHRGSATLGRGWSDFNGYHLWRNPVWLVAKCYPAAALLRHAPAILRGLAGNLYTALRERRLRTWARAMRDALRGLPGVIADRRRIQRGRTAGVADLERLAVREAPR